MPTSGGSSFGLGTVGSGFRGPGSEVCIQGCGADLLAC